MNSAALAKQIVTAAHARGGNALVSKIATYGYKDGQHSFELLCAIQDEAKAREAAMPDSLFAI